jgi:hypothetical protein
MTRASADAVQRGQAVRAQDPWVAEVMADREVRQAWSGSFKREPPAVLAPAGEPGAGSLAWLLRVTAIGDPRVLLLVAVLGLALAGARCLRGQAGIGTMGAALLAPGAALGAAFGSPDFLALGMLVFSWWLWRRRWPTAAAFLLGLAAGWVPLLLFLISFVVVKPDEPRPRRAYWVAGLVGGWLLSLLPALLTDAVRALAALLPDGRPAAGVGLPNVFLYWGAESSWAAHALAAALPPLVVLAAVLVARSVPGEARRTAWAAAFLLLGLWVSPAMSPLGLSSPAALLALAGFWGAKTGQL